MEKAKLERAYKTFVACREMIRSSTSEQQMLQSICDAAVSELGYRLAWIGMVSEADEQVHPAAQAGYEVGYLDSIRITWSDDDSGQGPTGRAIREHRPAVCQDIATDERFAPWRDDALRRGYASSAALPLCQGSRCLGTLNLYAAEPDAFDDDELALLEEVVIDLQLGIQCHRVQHQLDSLNLQIGQVLRTEAAITATTALSHDLNNLLQIVSAAITQAQRTSDSAVRERALADADAAVSSIVVLNRQLLSLGRRTAIRSTVTEIDRLIQGMTSVLGRLAPGADLDLDLRVRRAGAPIDSIDLERILINLVINAGHAMPGGGRLRITTDRRTLERETANPAGALAPGDYVAVSVIDQGPGIDPEILPHIFTPFFTTKTRQGTGLGLPAVLDLARTAGGGVEVDTGPDGTRVTVLLPIADSNAT